MTSNQDQYRKYGALVLRVAVTCGVFAYLLAHVDRAALWEALRDMPTFAVLFAIAMGLVAVGAGVIRWRLLLHTYGAQLRPRWGELWHWYMVSMFFNSLPGAVGGDVYRAMATRHYFAGSSTTRSVGVAFVERALGLSGLLFLAAVASLADPVFRAEVFPLALLTLIGATAAIFAVSLGSKFTRYLPQFIAARVSDLPNLVRWGPFLWAIPLSIFTQISVTLAGFVVIHSLAPAVTLSQAMVIFPVGALAGYFPLTVAGAGARDAALVVLLGQVGVPRSIALAASLCLLLSNLVVPCLGGLMHTRGSEARKNGLRSLP